MSRLLTLAPNRTRSFSKAIAVVAIALAVSASAPGCGVLAHGAGCTEACKAAFGSCYKSTANRAACEAQMQRCLEGCIQSKRG